MTSILKQENGELFLYRSGKPLPKQEDYYTDTSPVKGFDLHGYMTDTEEWFSTAERIKVAEGEAEKFKETIFPGIRAILAGCQDSHKEGLLNAGIEIPDTCYEVRESYKPGWQKIRLAYFKSPVVQEREVKDNLASEGATGEYEKTMRWAESELGLSSYSRESTDTPSPQELKEHAIEFAEWLKDKVKPLDPKHEWTDGTFVRLTSEMYHKFQSSK